MRKNKNPIVKIDAHIHLNVTAKPDDELSGIIKDLSELGFEKACLMPDMEKANNSDVQYAIRKYPERFYGIFILNFHNLSSLLSDFSNYISSGFRGIKLHPRVQEINLDNDIVRQLLLLCNNQKVPVIIDGFISDNEDGLRQLEFIQQATDILAKTKVIIAHFGGYRFKDILLLARDKNNIYFDLSFSLMYFLNKDLSILKQACSSIKEFGVGRFLYGSDYPEFGITEYAKGAESVLREAGLNDSEVAKVFGETASTIFESYE